MPVYVDRLIADTQDLSAEEFGVYWRLLCRQWSKGAIPCDVARQANIGGVKPGRMKAIREAIGTRLQRHETIKNCEYSPFMEDVRETMRLRNQKASENGRKGAQKRWQPDSEAIATLSQVYSDPIGDDVANGVANVSQTDEFQFPSSNKDTNVSGDGSPKQPPLLGRPSDIAAYRILDAAWPVISAQHDLAIKQKAWRQHNKRAAVELADAGKTPEDVVAMLEAAYGPGSRFYGGITTLAKLAEHWPKLAQIAGDPEDDQQVQRRIANGDYLPVADFENG